MPSLDTNCLLRWFLGDIPEQSERVEALVNRGEHLTIDDAAIIEAIFAMESGAKLRRATIQAFFLTAMTRPLAFDRTLWTSVLDTWVAHPKLSVVDVYLATKAQIADDGPLYTFDKKLTNQLPGTAVVP